MLDSRPAMYAPPLMGRTMDGRSFSRGRTMPMITIAPRCSPRPARHCCGLTLHAAASAAMRLPCFMLRFLAGLGLIRHSRDWPMTTTKDCQLARRASLGAASMRAADTRRGHADAARRPRADAPASARSFESSAGWGHKYMPWFTEGTSQAQMISLITSHISYRDSTATTMTRPRRRTMAT